MLAVIIVLLVVLGVFVVDLNEERTTKSRIVVEREKKEVQAPLEFVYFTGLELNAEIAKIVESGGKLKLWEFFDTFTSNREVTEVIFEESLSLEVPIVSAFALAWGESQYKIQAVHKNIVNGIVVSRDRGLYQLNDAHRKNWTEKEFFNVRKNTHEGLSVFKRCLKTFNEEVILAFGAYNKGEDGLKNGIIRYITINHINNIIRHEREMEIKLNYFINRWKYDQK